MAHLSFSWGGRGTAYSPSAAHQRPRVRCRDVGRSHCLKQRFMCEPVPSCTYSRRLVSHHSGTVRDQRGRRDDTLNTWVTLTLFIWHYTRTLKQRPCSVGRRALLSRADMVSEDALSQVAKGEMVGVVQMFREHVTRSGLGSAGVRIGERKGRVGMGSPGEQYLCSSTAGQR